MKKVLQLICCLFVMQTGFAQFTIPGKPKFQTSVYDYAHLLSDSEKSQLEDKLIKYSDSTSTQIVVAIIETLNNDDIAQVTVNWAQKWGIGQAKEDNGVFILVAQKDHKMYIAPGYGLEDKLTAGINGEIIRNVITPEFKKGNYYEGLDKGADELFKVFKGTYKGTRKSDGGGSPIPFFVIIFIIILVIISKSRRGGGGGSGGLGIGEAILLSSLGRGGGWGGSSGGGFGGGGGGFGGGFGGGGFSGGGAGGGW